MLLKVYVCKKMSEALRILPKEGGDHLDSQHNSQALLTKGPAHFKVLSTCKHHE
jgi:hypothetical protein